MLLLERRGAVQARTAALNQLDALVVTAPDALRERLARVPEERLVDDGGCGCDQARRCH